MNAPIYWPLVVLAMLGSHALTFKLMLRRIRDLEAGLVAKEVLLSGRVDDTATICPGGTMVLTVKNYVGRIRLYSKHYAQLRLQFEDA